MKLFLVCILLALAVNSAFAVCSRSPLKALPHKWSEKVFEYCEYNGMKYLEGSKFEDGDKCQSCSCTKAGLKCCGIGFYAGSMNVPGCTVVPDHCHTVILNKAKTALCHK